MNYFLRVTLALCVNSHELVIFMSPGVGTSCVVQFRWNKYKNRKYYI